MLRLFVIVLIAHGAYKDNASSSAVKYECDEYSLDGFFVDSSIINAGKYIRGAEHNNMSLMQSDTIISYIVLYLLIVKYICLCVYCRSTFLSLILLCVLLKVPTVSSLENIGCRITRLKLEYVLDRSRCELIVLNPTVIYNVSSRHNDTNYDNNVQYMIDYLNTICDSNHSSTPIIKLSVKVHFCKIGGIKIVSITNMNYSDRFPMMYDSFIHNTIGLVKQHVSEFKYNIIPVQYVAYASMYVSRNWFWLIPTLCCNCGTQSNSPIYNMYINDEAVDYISDFRDGAHIVVGYKDVNFNTTTCTCTVQFDNGNFTVKDGSSLERNILYPKLILDIYNVCVDIMLTILIIQINQYFIDRRMVYVFIDTFKLFYVV